MEELDGDGEQLLRPLNSLSSHLSSSLSLGEEVVWSQPLCGLKDPGTGPGLVVQLVRVMSPYAKITGFDLSGHIQEATNECKSKWNNKKMFLSLSPPLKSINLIIIIILKRPWSLCYDPRLLRLPSPLCTLRSSLQRENQARGTSGLQIICGKRKVTSFSLAGPEGEEREGGGEGQPERTKERSGGGAEGQGWGL